METYYSLRKIAKAVGRSPSVIHYHHISGWIPSPSPSLKGYTESQRNEIISYFQSKKLKKEKASK